VTTYTLLRPGRGGTAPGVQAVVAGGDGDQDATGGTQVATLHPGRWRERATALVDGVGWDYAKEGRDLVGRRSDDPGGTARLRASRVSFWSSRYELDLEGLAAQVQGSRNRVWTAGGQQLGASGHVGFWRPVPTLTLRDDVPVRHVVFLLWLEHVLTQRSRAAAAS
jgi:hypothetical protein